MQSSDQADHDELSRQTLMEKMPPAIRMALTIHDKKTFSNLAEMAVTIAELHGPQFQGLGPRKLERKKFKFAEIQKELGNICMEGAEIEEEEAGGRHSWYIVGTTSVLTKQLPSVMNCASLSSREITKSLGKHNPANCHLTII